MARSLSWPYKVKSPNVSAGYFWRKKHRVSKEEKAMVSLMVQQMYGADPLPDKATVTMIRIAPRKLDDDNNVGGMKHIRDGLASALGFKDDTEASGVKFICRQKRGKAKEYALLVQIE